MIQLNQPNQWSAFLKDIDSYQRLIVLGSSGSGKTTFARRLGAVINFPVIHLDSYYWRPNWTDTPLAEWRQIVSGLVARERWVIDGFYMNAYDITFDAAQAFIYLDQNRWVCLSRCVRRLLLHPHTNREELAEGCNEKIDREFLYWIWNWQRDVRPRVEAAIEKHPGKPVIWLSGSRAVADFLELAASSTKTRASSKAEKP